jgi:hypothetical protein
MGGIIRWRPLNPTAFDGTVRIGLVLKTYMGLISPYVKFCNVII